MQLATPADGGHFIGGTLPESSDFALGSESERK